MLSRRLHVKLGQQRDLLSGKMVLLVCPRNIFLKIDCDKEAIIHNIPLVLQAFHLQLMGSRRKFPLFHWGHFLCCRAF